MAQYNDKRRPKEALYALFAEVGQAMANAHRLELLDLLMQAPRTVEELAGETQMSIANTSQHLQRLKQSRLVATTREGTYIRYRLADPGVARLWRQLRAVAESQIAEVEQALDAYRTRRHEFERISAAELRARLHNGEVFLLDARPEVEYAAGHIPGAVSMPLEELERRLDELPADMPIVAYCRGPYCVMADEALALVARRGLQTLRLEEGVAEWQQVWPVSS
jgi:rhodanese-related sulfurtransferase/DNA-binding MarR family transcriptional regulator